MIDLLLILALSAAFSAIWFLVGRAAGRWEIRRAIRRQTELRGQHLTDLEREHLEKVLCLKRTPTPKPRRGRSVFRPLRGW